MQQIVIFTRKFRYWSVLVFVLIVSKVFSQSAGNFVSFSETTKGLRIKGTTSDLVIQQFSPDIFKVQLLKSGQAPYDSSACVVLKPQGFTQKINESTTKIEIIGGKSTLEITKNPLRISLKSGSLTKISEEQGIRLGKDSVYFSFKISPEDVFHGTGGRFSEINLNRKVLDFTNTYRGGYYDDGFGLTTGLSQSINLPFIVSSQKYGLLLDGSLPGDMRMYVGAQDSTKLNVEVASTGNWAYYFINGASNDEILQNYTLLTGRQPLPPRWALGYLQSKFGYKNETDAKDVLKKLQNEGFPVDAMILDLYWYGDGTTMGNFDWDKTKWPNSAQMIKDFAATGVQTVLINDPYVTNKSFNYALADSLKYFAKNANTNRTGQITMWNGTVGLLDIFNPNTQKWVWQKMKALANQGVSGFWSDKNEPENHPSNFIHVNGTASDVHNLYGLAWAKNIYDNYAADFPEKRVFNLSRSGYVGSQHYGVLPWSGDVLRVWSGLRYQIPMILHSGFSGLAYMHSDTGGFATSSDQSEKNEELDVRWLQFSTFSPILRSHGLRFSTEPYNLTQPFYGISKRYIKLRYELLPYLYSLAYKNSTTGRPICMTMDYFDLSKANGNIEDQYFFGENLVVAPILIHGMPLRKVVLPKGKWFNFWTNKLYNGETNIFENLTIDDIPVYARAGSIMPMSKSAKSSTSLYSSDSLVVRYYQDISVPRNNFTVFHDDGKDAKVLQNMRYELLNFSGKTSTDSVQIEATRTQNYAGTLSSRSLTYEVINLTSIPKSVSINKQNIPVVFREADFNKDNVAYYDTERKVLKVRTLWDCSTTNSLLVVRDGLSVITATEDELIEESTLNVYPNPSQANTELTFETIITQTAHYELEIYNMAGKSIYKQDLGKISQNEPLKHHWNNQNIRGVLIIQLTNNLGKVMNKKIVIE